ncbi:murein transglycosylase A [Sphingomonas sp. MG17]|uniref:peptidoglycan lytic exotransglycosylase n=1 Tax=Sphingomonas tagetis TaxID=2949092 RepID=A0A9X2HR21_9SPHN|nr:murein transglycosylase A [Sphingomonas tagetis]MCP3731928.1 murein transglycosylase A [Sphingomonas tagetis]
MRAWGVAALAVLLGACSSGVVPSRPGSASSAPRPVPASPSAPVRQPVAATPLAPVSAPAAPASATTAAAAGLVAGPAIERLPITMAGAARALTAFRTSCPTLVRRTDASGLTRGEDWRAACDAAKTAQDREAAQFFATHFEAVQVADGKAFATGYYEPEIAGSRTRRTGYEVPIYGRPSDLVDVDLGKFSDAMKGKSIRGRVEGTNFVPYHERTAIEQGALQGRGLEIAWASDPVELFFLQIQGSGRLRLPDGGVMRIGYASQNGRDYTGIGRLMLDRGVLKPGQASMQGIMAYLRENPAQGRDIMRENKSYVFFRELTGPGPLGAMGHPVSARGSVATDPKFVPLGAPVFLSMDRQDANGLWVAQDTGGAIKGTNRFDTFWGAGDEARAVAGGMAARGTAWLLLPKGTLARLTGN